MNKLESPSLKDALRHVWLKLAQYVVLDKIIFKCRQLIFAISYLSPHGKGRGPSFKKRKTKLESICENALYQVWMKLAQWFWREELKI